MSFREHKKVVTMRLSEQDDNIIKELARQDNLSKSAWIRRCIFKKINEYEQQKYPPYQDGLRHIRQGIFPYTIQVAQTC